MMGSEGGQERLDEGGDFLLVEGLSREIVALTACQQAKKVERKWKSVQIFLKKLLAKWIRVYYFAGLRVN
jgi:hypothetical protein